MAENDLDEDELDEDELDEDELDEDEDELDEDEDLAFRADDIAVRAMAAALCDGDWEPRAMRARLDSTIEPSAHDPREEVTIRAWLVSMVIAAQEAFTTPPSLEVLASWIARTTRFVDLGTDRARFRVLRYPTPSPAMRESRWPVPALATTRELAMWLGVSIDALGAWMRETADSPIDDSQTRGYRELDVAVHVFDPRARHYRYAWIAKAHGYRLLEAPKPRLRTIQRDLLDGIIGWIPPHDAAFGFRAGRSVVDFATQHVGRDTVIRLDLKAFFTSVFAPRVAGILRTAGYPEGVARTIAALCTHRTPPDVLAREPDLMQRARLRTPHLPQGAPTSGALANVAAYRLDVRVSALARRIGATYGRYADDLVLSGERTLAKNAPTVIARIGAIAIDEGFVLNYRKTRVMTSGDQQRIAGVVVNAKPAMQRHELERLRALLTNCARTTPAAQNRDGISDFRAHLRGRIAWVTSLDPVKGERLRALFEQIRWD